MDPPPYYQPPEMAPVPSEKSQLDAIQPGIISNSGQGFVVIQPPLVGYINGGPTVFYKPKSSPTTVVYKDFKGCQSKFLGIAQIIIGVIFVAFNVVSNYYAMEFPFEPFGMCIGAFFIITGLFGITSGALKKRGFMIVFLVLSVISFVVVILVLLQTSVSLYKMLKNECDYNSSQPAYKDDVIYQDEMRHEVHSDEYMYPDDMRHERHHDEYIYPGEKQFESISDDSLFLKRRPVMHPDPILPGDMHPNEYMSPDDIIPDEFWPYDVTTTSDIQSGDVPYDADYSGNILSGKLPVDEEYSDDTHYYKTTTSVTTKIQTDEVTTTEATTTQEPELIVDVFPWYQEPPDEDHDHGSHYDDDPYYDEFTSESTPRQRNDEISPILEDWWWSGESAYDNNDNEGYWSCLPWYQLRLAVYSVLIILSVLQGIFSIWGSIICCKAEICCCKEKIKIQPNFDSVNGNQKAFIVTVPNIASHFAYNNGYADTKVQPYEFTNSAALNSEDVNSNIKEKINLGFEYGAE